MRSVSGNIQWLRNDIPVLTGFRKRSERFLAAGNRINPVLRLLCKVKGNLSADA
jgi:hypothetical protein